jgi:hypothetical protein
MLYFCCDQRRRNAVDASALNGIDFLEVLDSEAPPGSPRQQTLLVRCFKPVSGLAVDNMRIEGGERITPVRVVWAFPAPAIPGGLITAAEKGFFDLLPEEDHVLVVRTESPGDFSTYRLMLVKPLDDVTEPDGFDPMLSAVDFSFKVECPSDFDCKEKRVCPPEPRREPEIDCLAKDYASFRRLMLDRMAVLMPQWRERNPADLGIALVELLAYVGDHLSYQQDATQTEAYLGTARRRISVRRHARLVDYFVHDGCNARVWVQVQVEGDGIVKRTTLSGGGKEFVTKLLTRIPSQRAIIEPDTPAYHQALAARPVIFELLEDATLFEAHNKMEFYTWGDEECCLPKGATQATLGLAFPKLKKGDVLIFEEVLGPLTGQPGDADPARRHAVRLSEAPTVSSDPLTQQPITKITWAAEDALPFPLCISAVTDKTHGSQFIENVSVARGNVVLVDHGLTIQSEELGEVPEPAMFRVPAPSVDRCEPRERVPVPPRFRQALKEAPLTQAAPYDPLAPASAAMRWNVRDAMPQIALQSDPASSKTPWTARRDLLNSGPHDRDFVVEVEADGTTSLRFGDDQHGVRPASQTIFVAPAYRVGNGLAGNVGADSIFHIVTSALLIVGVRNPLPATGGVEPESIDEVRNKAPSAFRVQERAVTEADYAEVTERVPDVQRAAATFRWTGSWHTVFVTVDRRGGLPVDALFEEKMRSHLERFRMAGYDLEVDAPRFVSLEIEMLACAKPGYFRSDVKAALLEVFSNRILPDGRRGVFHPDNFSFGEPVYLSRFYAAAQGVPGVASVHITLFQRQGKPETKPMEEGKLSLNRLEIARLDNDPNFPEHGVFRVTVGGGK